MIERTLHTLSDDELLDLLTELERVQTEAEAILMARMGNRQQPRPTSHGKPGRCLSDPPWSPGHYFTMC